MRDPNRLDEFYDKLKEIHKNQVPDWRFMQLVCNVQYMFHSDGFYLEEDKFLELLEHLLGTEN